MNSLVHLKATVQSPLGKFSGRVTKDPVSFAEVQALQNRFMEDIHRDNELNPSYMTLSADRNGACGTFMLPKSLLAESVILFLVVPHDQPSFEGFLDEEVIKTTGHR